MARIGLHVTCWIPRQQCSIWQSARHGKAGVTDKVVLQHATLLNWRTCSHSIVRCNSLPHILEFATTGCCVTRCGSHLAGCIAILSVLVRNQAGEVSRPRSSGRFGSNGKWPTAEWAQEYCTEAGYDYLRLMVCELRQERRCGIAERGVRVLADICRPGFSHRGIRNRFLRGRKLGSRQTMPQSPATYNALARCMGSVAEGGGGPTSCRSFGHRIQCEGA